ncbi:phytase [uncultured Phenylobacterium sp.]|uniref:phytase n=1 Tax=uncultured Phenylobacterium sp. TaxID=349273 RepID=UPI0025DC2C54|nr:phytase [uncultured Phenylobacterium sp.]
MFGRQIRDGSASVLIAALLASSCSTLGPEDVSDSGGMAVGVGAPVPAAAETPSVGTLARDAADDPEIWVDPTNRSRGVILGTDKQAGLYVYDLAGRLLQYLAGGKPNNVDLRDGFPTPAGERVLVAASDRGRPGAGAALFLLDPATLKLSLWGAVPVDLAEPYGLCLARRGEAFLMIVNGTDGQVRQLRVAVGADGKPQLTEERRFAVATQPEGCVADDSAGRLYLGEEGRGVWRFDLGTGPAAGRLIAEAPSAMLKPDVEGLTLLREGTVTYLIASSQGDSAFAVWNVEGAEPHYRGRFSVMAAGGVDAVTGTDGVAAMGGAVGAYREGLVVVQDDVDQGATGGRQNFKLVDWREVRRALGL